MKHFFFAAIFLTLLAAAGCDTVTIDRPLGTPLEASEVNSIVGRWLGDEQLIDIRIAQDKQLFVGTMDWDEDARAFTANTIAIDVRRTGSVAYMFIKAEDHYGLVRLDIVSASELRMYSPNATSFRDAVREGRISGQVLETSDGHFKVQLKADADTTLTALSSADRSNYFPEDSCQVFRRLGPPHTPTE